MEDTVNEDQAYEDLDNIEYTVNEDRAYEDLANAIIERAVYDYKDALLENDTYEIVSIEKFFKSDFYLLLTKVDGEYIMNRVKKRIKNLT